MLWHENDKKLTYKNKKIEYIESGLNKTQMSMIF
jgi:hypothetical protein